MSCTARTRVEGELIRCYRTPRVRLGVDPRLQFGWQSCPRCAGHSTCARRVASVCSVDCRARSAASLLCRRRLADHRDDLILLHPSSPRKAGQLTCRDWRAVGCMLPRRYNLGNNVGRGDVGQGRDTSQIMAAKETRRTARLQQHSSYHLLRPQYWPHQEKVWIPNC